MKESKGIGRVLVDAQASGEAKYGSDIDPAAVELHACVHIALGVAAINGRTRREIERRAMLGKGTLDDYISCKQGVIMKIDQFARLLMDPAVLGAAGHRRLIEEIAIRNSARIIDVDFRDEVDGLLEESLDVGDANGALAAAVRDAVDPDSPGGSRITKEEQIVIGGFGRVVIDEAMDMIPHVESVGGR